MDKNQVTFKVFDFITLAFSFLHYITTTFN